MFRLGYNTNGLAHHRPAEALLLCAELGYEGVAITPDVGGLDPLALDPRVVREVRAVAEGAGLALALETGARYVLDPRRKHAPTLLEDRATDRARRLDFLVRSIDLAADVGADVVSFWSGRAPDGAPGDPDPFHPDPGSIPPASGADAAWDRLTAATATLLARARDAGVRLALEPEPGMFLERPAGYVELCARLGDAGRGLGLCLDVGHCLCTGDLPVEDVLRRHARDLAMVQLDDAKDGVHEHLMFGRGDLDLRAVLATLLEIGYAGMAAVELSRDSHRGPEAAREALQHLRRALADPRRPDPGSMPPAAGTIPPRP